MTRSHATKDRRRPPVAAILVVPVAVALVLTLFAWPNARLGPRDLPIGVAGPPAAAGAIEHRLSAQDGAFDLRRYRDAAAAREAIEDREVYGAFVAGSAVADSSGSRPEAAAGAPGAGTGATVLTAAAASPAVAQMLTHAAAESGARVEEVVPGPPRGAALASSVLPLVLAGILTGAVATALAAGGRGRAGLVLVGSALAGLAATAIVQSWLEVIGGNWAANAAALSLTVLAIASVVAGLKARFGEAGLVAGALTMVLVGNPFSGVGSAPELLPQPVGGLGQLLPPGAGGNLLRSTGFFDGAAAGGHVWVLAAWAAAGLGLLLTMGVRGHRAERACAAVAAAARV